MLDSGIALPSHSELILPLAQSAVRNAESLSLYSNSLLPADAQWLDCHGCCRVLNCNRVENWCVRLDLSLLAKQQGARPAVRAVGGARCAESAQLEHRPS